MHDDRLPTEVWVMAHIRQCLAEGIPATVAHKGDTKGGTLMLKLNQLGQGCRVLSQARDLDGAARGLVAVGDQDDPPGGVGWKQRQRQLDCLRFAPGLIGHGRGVLRGRFLCDGG